MEQRCQALGFDLAPALGQHPAADSIVNSERCSMALALPLYTTLSNELQIIQPGMTGMCLNESASQPVSFSVIEMRQDYLKISLICWV